MTKGMGMGALYKREILVIDDYGIRMLMHMENDIRMFTKSWFGI